MPRLEYAPAHEDHTQHSPCWRQLQAAARLAARLFDMHDGFRVTVSVRLGGEPLHVPRVATCMQCAWAAGARAVAHAAHRRQLLLRSS